MSTRQQLLQTLRANQGRYCSGQALADSLGVSRAAVHKAAAALVREGWDILAAPRRGYCLSEAGDILSPEALGPWDAPVYVYRSIVSTNAAMRVLSATPARSPHGTLILAESQTGGLGRHGRIFESPPGGLYMTLLLRPDAQADNPLAVTGSAAVAVCRAVEALCGLELSIKWVNDLYYKGKKVCGILTQADIDVDTGTANAVAVGIGLNLAVPEQAFPPELRRTAISLYPEGASPVGRAQLAGAIARELLSMCPTFQYLPEYRRLCFVPGHWVTVAPNNGATYTARAVSIDDAGHLVVETTSGRRYALHHEEVSIRPVTL